SLADLYVNDAFAMLHRSHASIVGVPAFVQSVPGLSLEREMARLLQVMETPERPLGLLLGGSNMRAKVAMVERMLPLASVVCIGGALASVIMQLRAGVTPLSASVVANGPLRRISEALLNAECDGGVRIVLPADVVASRHLDGRTAVTMAAAHRVQAGWEIGDIGHRTVDLFSEALAPMKTVVWSGPLGRAEEPQFADGTVAM